MVYMVLVAACRHLHTRQGFAASSLMSRHDQRMLIQFDSDMARHLTMPTTLLTGRHYLLHEDGGDNKTGEMYRHVFTLIHGNCQAQSIGLHN